MTADKSVAFRLKAREIARGHAMPGLGIALAAKILALCAEVAAEAKAEEREACAKLAETTGYWVVDYGPVVPGKSGIYGLTTFDNRDAPQHYKVIAAAIRAR